ncbi:MAG: hypothetical protein LBI19_03335 [Oscillospiraceae bacterium]|jgi:hypothetical protein|nr:hypothetical protein [Oscillospiraceae bacterium]
MMEELKTYYKEQADTQPEPFLAVTPAEATVTKRRPVHRVGLVAASLVLMLAVTMAIPGVRAAVGEWMIDIVTGEKREMTAPPDVPEKSDELLDKYVGDWDTNKSSNLFSVRPAKLPREGWTGTMRGGWSDYEDQQAFMAALEGSGFRVRTDFSGVFTAEIRHPLKSDVPLREWEEEGYIIREYEVDTDTASSYHTLFDDNNRLLQINMNLLQVSGVNVPGERAEAVSVAGWETAIAVYRESGEFWPLSLYLTNPIPGDIVIPEYGDYPERSGARYSLHCDLSGDGYTLEELIAIAETLG